VLDGGLDAWVKAGHPLSTEVPPDRAGTLAPLTVRPLVVDAEFVKTNLGARGIAIVDGRNSGFYNGTQTGGGPTWPHKAGHIRGAGSVPFGDTVDPANRLKSAAELQKLLANAGVRPGDTVVAYCHIGQQATQVILAARTLGLEVLLYDGSFEEWSRKGYPVENPGGKLAIRTRPLGKMVAGLGLGEPVTCDGLKAEVPLPPALSRQAPLIVATLGSTST